MHAVIHSTVQRDAIDLDLLATTVDEAVARQIAPLQEALTALRDRAADSPAEPTHASDKSGDRAAAVEVAEAAPVQTTSQTVDEWLNAVLRPRRRTQVESWSTALPEEKRRPQDGAT